MSQVENEDQNLLYIYVTQEGPQSDQKILPAPATLAELAESKEVKNNVKFSKASREGLPLYDPSIRRYSRFHLKGALQFMGIKPHQAVQITETIFQMLGNYEEKGDLHALVPPRKGSTHHSPAVKPALPAVPASVLPSSVLSAPSPIPSPSITAASTERDSKSDGVTLPQSQFLHIVRSVLASYDYTTPEAMGDFSIARSLQDKKHSFTILLGGTSGCGKSTLASLLASRIGFTTVISTDHIRHMLRAFITKDDSPVLWASTYHAGECVKFPAETPYKEQILRGWEMQNAVLYEKLDELIGNCENRRESIIIEGVHLSADIMKRLLARHPTCIPFLVYISNEAKHKERFAIRAKYMTIDPRHNKYVKYIKNIRLISDYLVRTMDQCLIPKIDNTNIDRSIATIHSIILGCIRRFVNSGEPFWDKERCQAITVHQEYEKQSFVSSSRMLKFLEAKARAAAQATQGAEPDDEKDLDFDDESSSKNDDFFDGGSLGS